MLAFQSMIHKAAKDAGMEVPAMELLDAFDGEPTWDPEEYPHFHVFCNVQLGRSMHSMGQHWDNAKIVAAVPVEELRTVTLEGLIAKGLEL